MERFILTILLTISLLPAFSQNVRKEIVYETKSSKVDTVITVDSNLDAYNTFTRAPFVIAFNPFLSLTIQNTDSILLYYPGVTFNKRDWSTVSGLQSDFLKPSLSEKERQLALWHFLLPNRIHAGPAEQGSEIHDPVKMFNVYGNGICDDMAELVGNLSYANSLGLSRIWGMYGHVVGEVNFGSRFALLDPDIEVFYLMLDNETLASYDDIINDRYLAARTHGYGINQSSSLERDRAVSLIYGNDFSYGSSKQTSTDAKNYTLRPNESISFNTTNDESNLIYHEYPNQNSPNVSYILSNGLLEHKIPVNINLDKIFFGRSNFHVQPISRGQYGIQMINQEGNNDLTYKVALTYPFVDARISGNVIKTYDTDTLSVFFSKDNLKWEEVYRSSLLNDSFSVALTNNIATKDDGACYSYYLKFHFKTSSAVTDVSLYNLSVRSFFQVSKASLPRLQKGNNLMSYRNASSNSCKAKITMSWQENILQHAPNNDVIPIYPSNNQDVDRSQFKFSWSNASDQDGDKIVDYEFQLSEREDMKYIFSPNFNRYTSKANNNSLLINEFSIPWPGLLNPETRYFWHVRAKDEHGTWGDWSETWSFVCKGITPPANLNYTNDVDSLYLKWEADISKEVKPVGFKIYGSNEAQGFIPDNTSFIAECNTSFFNIPLNSNKLKAFYRIVAVAANGDVSTPTPVLSVNRNLGLKYYDGKDLYTNNLDISLSDILPGAYTLNFNSETNKFDTTFYTHDIEFLDKPSWLNFDTETQDFRIENDSVYTSLYYEDDLNSLVKLVLSSEREGKDTITFNIRTIHHNSPPVCVKREDLKLTIYQSFKDTLSVDDVDIPYGDSISLKALYLPPWVEFDAVTGVLSGTATKETLAIDSVVIVCYDKKNATDTFKLRMITDKFPVSLPSSTLPVYVNEKLAYNLKGFAGTKFSNTLVVVDVLPVWLYLDETNSTLRGIPRLSDMGEINIQVVLIDTVNNLSYSYQLSIDVLLKDENSLKGDNRLKGKVFPNPIKSGSIRYEYVLSENVEMVFKLLDQQGKHIQTYSPIAREAGNYFDKFIIPNSLPAGIYYLNIHAKNGQGQSYQQSFKIVLVTH